MRIKLQFININVKIPLVEFLFNTNEHARVTFMPCKKLSFYFMALHLQHFLPPSDSLCCVVRRAVMQKASLSIRQVKQ